MAKKTSRPGRTLIIFFLCVGALYGLAALGGTWKPQLGLDLSGGTRITLQATNDNVDQQKLKEAKAIIENRVNGSGVVEPEVTVQGNKNIIVEIPGKNPKDLVDAVKRTAQLRFRLVASSGGQPVITSGVPATTSPTASPSATPSPGATPSKKVAPKASASPTATPKPRPAPHLAPAADTPSPSATPTATPAATPSAVPTPTVAATSSGADVDNPLAWSLNPGDEWLQKFAAFTCTKDGVPTTPMVDDPDQPLVACDSSGSKYLLSKAVIEGTDLKSANAGIPQNQVAWAVDLALKGGDPTKTFADISRKLLDNNGRFAIVLDGQVLSAPGFNGVIPDGKAQITGNFTEKSATSLANSLKFGALPIKFDPNPLVETVGATLAGDQLHAGIVAGLIGLLLVMIFCLIYYRGLGLVVVGSLIVAGLVTYGTVLVLAHAAGFTLTLPGIAGLIVAVGITADSFIVYFERIRDEMRLGKSMRVAVESGWFRARNTCLAADSVSLLAAVVLYVFAIGVVRGFAFALGVSTIIDVIVFFWFTKPAVSLLARRPYFNNGGKWSGLSKETLGIDEPAPVKQTVSGGVA